MSKLYQTVYSCLQKTPPAPEEEEKKEEETQNPEDVKENDAPELTSDKKTDEIIEPVKQPGYIWRISSGIYNTASGAVGLGVGSVKWVAGKSYDAGSAVINTSTAVVKAIPKTVRRKDKNE